MSEPAFGVWQPISTAQKHFRHILLGWWDGPEDAIDRDWISIAGWYEAGPADQCWYDILNERVQPTHWMPLPAPPATDLGRSALAEEGGGR